jgi:hypothetical protein
MKTTSFLLLYLLVFSVFAQEESYWQVHETQVEDYFTQELRQELNITYPIFRVYGFKDKLGTHYLVLSEHTYSNQEPEPQMDSIKAVCINVSNEKPELEWSINDFILRESNQGNEENSIWFWTKFLKLEDIDKDSIIEPILVYGTSGINGTDDGRVKLLTFYHGQKKAIRHQNSPLDYLRNTQVDKSFYELPTAIQERVKEVMEEIIHNNSAIFPYGWQEAMQKKTLKFDEN